jgi:hypothetical protein
MSGRINGKSDIRPSDFWPCTQISRQCVILCRTLTMTLLSLHR